MMESATEMIELPAAGLEMSIANSLTLDNLACACDCCYPDFGLGRLAVMAWARKASLYISCLMPDLTFYFWVITFSACWVLCNSFPTQEPPLQMRRAAFHFLSLPAAEVLVNSTTL